MNTAIASILAPLLLLAGLSSTARAATNGFLVPPFRGAPGSEAGYWEVFSIAAGGPGNPADRAGATTDALLTQSDTNAFLTGSGNIYNLAGVSVFTLEDATPFALGTVVLQTRTIGSELDYGSLTLHCSNGAGTYALSPRPRVELNRGTQPGLGATVSSLWQWDLSGLGVTAYRITFQAAAPSLSFDSLTLDTSAQFVPLFTRPFAVNDPAPVIERWMYANNAAPCDRPAGSVFATFGDEAGVDTRHAQHLLGWDTAGVIPAQRGPSRYRVHRARVTLTIQRGNLFVYDPTPDDFRTALDTNDPAWQADADAGRPVELFGVGYRNGYDAASFDACAPFGSNAAGQRNAYAAGWGTNGMLVDVGNHVGKTNAAFHPFAVAPFAVGQTTNAAPGQPVPAGARITFDLNLADPFVLAYVQGALNSGRLRLMVSSLHASAGQLGAPNYPEFATRFNELVVNPTRLEVEGVIVGDGDLDSDGLPDDWELDALHSLTHGGAGDVDGDGASNLDEYRSGTDPLVAASVARLEAVAGAGDGRLTLRGPVTAGHVSTVEFSDGFAGWMALPVAPVFEPGAGVAWWTDVVTNGTVRFYRLRMD